VATAITLIEAKTLASSTTLVTFSAIPATYTDLQLLISVKSSAGATASYIGFNSSQASFSGQYLYSNPPTAPVGGTLARYIGSQGSNGFASYTIYIPNYASAKYKPFSVDNTDGNFGSGANLNMTCGLWANTAAINSIEIDANGNNMLQYSTFYLYGISNA